MQRMAHLRWAAAACALLAGAGSLQAGTVAYWRFEEGPADAPVPHAGAAGVFDGSTPDVSGNGNLLSAWTEGSWAGFAYREDVPAGVMPQDGSTTNRFSIQNTGSYPATFTSSADSSPTGIDVEAITPAAFTIEASYKPEANGEWRTVVGRDAQNVATGSGSLAALYLQVRPDDSARIQFVDVSGVNHEAYSCPGLIAGFDGAANPTGVGAPWYHLVGVSDGSTLSLYVNNVPVGSTDMTLSGSTNTALAIGTANGADWHAGGWSVGRGLYGGAHEDRAYGFIDEVRISNAALAPSDFLFAPKAHIESMALAPGTLTLAGSRGHPGGNFDLLYGIDLSVSPDFWTKIAGGVFDASGEFFLANPFTGADLAGYYLVKARIEPPAPGPLTYELAGGHESWPSGIRDEIVYAMEGAVALYNRYGTFPKHLYANYNPGVPTAQASYSGWIDFGGQRGYRTALHEISHTLGVGTIAAWNQNLSGGLWTGASGIAQIEAFDGAGAVINSDGTHFWPYGLNFDNEASTENNRRHVLMVYAFRQDMGIQ